MAFLRIARCPFSASVTTISVPSSQSNKSPMPRRGCRQTAVDYCRLHDNSPPPIDASRPQNAASAARGMSTASLFLAAAYATMKREATRLGQYAMRAQYRCRRLPSSRHDAAPVMQAYFAS